MCYYIVAALSDLNKTLELAPSGRTRCKALCQRGLLLRKQDRIDDAKTDFIEAVKLGSKFAQSQVKLFMFSTSYCEL